MDIEKIIGIGNIFSKAIQTNGILINNYQNIDFYVFCGDGIYAETTVTIQGASGEHGEWKNINFQKVVEDKMQERQNDTIAIGRNGMAQYRVETKMLQDKTIDRLRFCSTKIGACIVDGLVLIGKSKPRYII